MADRSRGPRLAPGLELVWITDGRGDEQRIVAITKAATSAGPLSVQVREPDLSVRRLCRLFEQLRPLVASCGGLLIVNDRADLAAAGHCDGVHLRFDSLTVAEVRRFAPRLLIGVSVHDANEATGAVGADYVTISPVWQTRSKPLAKPLLPAGARSLASLCPAPASWLGGITGENASRTVASGAAGLSVQSAISDAADPAAAVATLRAALLSGDSR